MKKYVIGFMFNSKLNQVVLIEKKRPDWQYGFRNGIGGKVELHESSIEAMIREFAEETGFYTEVNEWEKISSMFNDNFKCDIFRNIRKDKNLKNLSIKTTTDEKVVIVPIKKMGKVLSNVKWIVYQLIDMDVSKDYNVITTIKKIH